MIAFNISYKVRNSDKVYSASIDAKDIKSAKKKLGKKHGYKDGRMIDIQRSSVIGYF